MQYNPHNYQTRATNFVESHKEAALFLDMGLGKTVSTLTALKNLIDWCEVRRVLVVAPKSVAQNTWSGECAKWDHLSDLRVSIIMGTEKKRMQALKVDADIYVINRDNLKWLVDMLFSYNIPWPFDTVVLDESTSFKNHKSGRFKALKSVRGKIERIIELTGTPAPNGLEDLWAQIYLLDGGERLGYYISQYRDRYFRPGRGNGTVVYEWLPCAGAKEKIAEQIADISLSMKSEDYLEMPKVSYIYQQCPLEPREMEAYRQFEEDFVMSSDTESITAQTAAALANKLIQFTGGTVYDDDKKAHTVSSTKIDTLKDMVEAAESPVLVYYGYTSERDRIMEELKAYKPVYFNGQPEVLTDWNAGNIKVMIAHPASVAYGLNMQDGGHIIIWYTTTWNLELYEQANARLYRQGQTHPVLIYHLVAPDTIDGRITRVLEKKDKTQDSLLLIIKELFQGVTENKISA